MPIKAVMPVKKKQAWYYRGHGLGDIASLLFGIHGWKICKRGDVFDMAAGDNVELLFFHSFNNQHLIEGVLVGVGVVLFIILNI